jgi:hypothetical protein
MAFSKNYIKKLKRQFLRNIPLPPPDCENWLPLEKFLAAPIFVPDTLCF